MLCGPACTDHDFTGPVVVTVDGSSTAESALEPAREVAAALGVKLWVISVVPEATSANVAERQARGEHVSESGYVRALVDRLTSEGVDAGWEIVHDDDAAQGVAAFVRALEAAVVVCASHGRSGVAREVFGRVSMGIVEHSPAPVLVVRSDTPDPAELV